MPRFDPGNASRRLGAGLALTGVAVWAARQLLEWLRRKRPDPRGDPRGPDLLAVTGGPIIVPLQNGKLLSARRGLFPSPAQRLRFTPIGTAPGEGAENVQLGGVSLAPAADVFGLTAIESFPGGFDSLVEVRRAETDAILFHGTDNTLAPGTVWRGDDPTAPPWLLAAQRRLDAEWEEFRRDVPGLERRIAVGRFDDVASVGEAMPAGWTAAGALRVSGRTQSLVDEGAGYIDVGFEPWWAIVGPDGAGRWGIRDSGHGEVPSTYPAVTVPPRVLDVTIADGRLMVEGVAQVDRRLDAAIVSVDGPFS